MVYVWFLCHIYIHCACIWSRCNGICLVFVPHIHCVCIWSRCNHVCLVSVPHIHCVCWSGCNGICLVSVPHILYSVHCVCMKPMQRYMSGFCATYVYINCSIASCEYLAVTGLICMCKFIIFLRQFRPYLICRVGRFCKQHAKFDPNYILHGCLNGIEQFPRTLPLLSRISRKPVLANKYYVKRFNTQISTTY